MRSDPRIVQALKSAVKRVALRRGVLVRKLPAGRQGDAFADQQALLSEGGVRTILDVGAYVGETALQYRRLFPSAEIHCFEPVPDSFDKLSAAVADDRRIAVNRAAVGAAKGSIDLHVNRSAFTSSILKPADETRDYLDGSLFEEAITEPVNVITIDDYCAERGIEDVDVLKLDIQGAELTALSGASDILSRSAIRLIYTEVLIAPMYVGQSRFGDVLTMCDGYGYRLYGLYNFAYGVDTRLYQMDAILISPKLALRKRF